MPLPRNKQVALFMLLSTRSVYRKQLEGGKPTTPDNPPNAPQKFDEMKANFLKVTPPNGITAADIKTLTDDEATLKQMFVAPGTSKVQRNNISTDPELISAALGIQYDPADPDCPNGPEADIIAADAVKDLPSVKP